MKLIIAGGRDYCLTAMDLMRISEIKGVSECVSGGASGVDADGELWASLRHIPVKVFKPDWNLYGRRAGPIRNRDMAQYADAVVLFPGGRGTDSMFREATKAGIKIFDWRGS